MIPPSVRPQVASLRTGLVIANLGDMYATTVVSGVVDEVKEQGRSAGLSAEQRMAGVVDEMREQGVSLVCFAGGAPEATDPVEAASSFLYDLISRENVDGLVLVSGTLIDYVGAAGLERFCRRFTFPIVSIALQVAGAASVLVDNDTAVREVVRHLAHDHGRRSIAFIAGRRTNAESEQRFAAYRGALNALEIPFDEALVVDGDFTPSAGTAAVRTLCDERQKSFDAIFASNDEMAVAAIRALQMRGIDVPRDVSVVGFDDIEESRYIAPPLTTVRQPLYEQGRRAASLLIARLRGENPPNEVILPTSVVVRRSCGCFPHAVRDAATHALAARSNPPKEGGAGSTAQRLEKRLSVIPPAVVSDFPSGRPVPVSDWATARDRAAIEIRRSLPDRMAQAGGELPQLLEAFWGAVRSDGREEFLAQFDSALGRWIAKGGDVATWQTLVSAMRRAALPLLVRDETELLRAEDLLHQTRVLVTDTAQRAQAHKRFASETRARQLSAISQSLITAVAYDDLVALGPSLARQAGSCRLCLFDAAGPAGLRARLVMQVKANGESAFYPNAEPFDAQKLVPEGMSTKGTFAVVVQPLVFKTEGIGYVMFDLDLGRVNFYIELRDQLSGALKRIEREHEVLRLHAEEKETARELALAYETLKNNQEKLLMSEKMASLGRLTAGMAHEMNTPIAAVRMALEEIEKLTREYAVSIGDPTVTADDYVSIGKDMEAAIRVGQSAAERVAGFVRGIKAQTRDLGARDRLRFNAIAVVKETLLLLNHALRQGNCSVTFRPSSDAIELSGPPGRFAQVVTNLVTNAIDAVRSRKEGATINIELLRAEGAGVELKIADNGAGIAPEHLRRIFDPMFTTKPFGEGTGLGLTIVHGIVTSDFGGSIAVDSEPGRGTTFTLHFSDARGAHS